ncbi:MAG: Type 1 glutamine amidotransferase-like domain-containing protein [Bacilli bacterium]|nr:Type 1 glutamine amidotransferase-like domain-containing protein [Bacilli bacterium]
MKYFLIGNGSIGRRGQINELEPFDKIIVEHTKKDNPNFLFIGLASSFADSYYDIMKNNYKRIGCNTSYLKKSNLVNNPDIVKKKIFDADIIYLGGGDSKKLLDSIKEYHLDQLLKESKAIIVGISAGANVLCNKGLSDYEIENNISNNYVFVDGLSFININLCPHGEDEKRLSDISLDKSINKVLILPTNTMIEVDNNKIKSYSINDEKVILREYKSNTIIDTEVNELSIESII